MNPMSKVRQFLFPNDKVRLIEIPIVSKLIQLTDVSNNTKTVAFVSSLAVKFFKRKLVITYSTIVACVTVISALPF